jgi:hypothetical protein
MDSKKKLEILSEIRTKLKKISDLQDRPTWIQLDHIILLFNR